VAAGDHVVLEQLTVRVIPQEITVTLLALLTEVMDVIVILRVVGAHVLAVVAATVKITISRIETIALLILGVLGLIDASAAFYLRPS